MTFGYKSQHIKRITNGNPIYNITTNNESLYLDCEELVLNPKNKAPLIINEINTFELVEMYSQKISPEDKDLSDSIECQIRLNYRLSPADEPKTLHDKLDYYSKLLFSLQKIKEGQNPGDTNFNNGFNRITHYCADDLRETRKKENLEIARNHFKLFLMGLIVLCILALPHVAAIIIHIHLLILINHWIIAAITGAVSLGFIYLSDITNLFNLHFKEPTALEKQVDPSHFPTKERFIDVVENYLARNQSVSFVTRIFSPHSVQGKKRAVNLLAQLNEKEADATKIILDHIKTSAVKKDHFYKLTNSENHKDSLLYALCHTAIATGIIQDGEIKNNYQTFLAQPNKEAGRSLTNAVLYLSRMNFRV
jgi:hypothetical protein